MTPAASRLLFARLIATVLCTGGAGLVYQVVWTRRLISMTRATVVAQAIVLGVFMAGLGLGAWLAGRRSARLRRPLLAFAVIELAAVAIAAVSLPLIGASDGIRTAVAAAGVNLSSGLWLQLLLVSAFLLVPTTLLGASLPLLIEYVERASGRIDLAVRGRVVGALYGFNTLGAAAGSLVAGFVMIETWGLQRSIWLGAGAAVLGVAISLLGIRRPEPKAPQPAASAEQPSVEVYTGGDRVEVRFMVAAFLSGLVGLGAEVVWTRLMLLIVHGTVYSFAQVLGAVLIGIAVGAWLAAGIARAAGRRPDGRQHVLRAAALLALFAAVLMATVPHWIRWLALDMAFRNDASSGLAMSSSLFKMGLVLVPPSAAVAAALPLLVTASGASDGSRAFGLLYASNTAGSVIGSVAVGMLLLPWLGTGGAGLVLVLACLGLGVLLLPSGFRFGRFVAIAATITALLLTASIRLPVDIYRAWLPEKLKILEVKEGRVNDVMITDYQQSRSVYLNANMVARADISKRRTSRHHQGLGHLPMLFVAQPKRVLGIALGTGQTFAAVMKHADADFDCVEIDPVVIELSRRWFKEQNDDGRAFMRATEHRYDLIVLEPLQAFTAGTSNLYTREFYEDARRILAPGGVVAQWIPIYLQGVDETRAMVRAGQEVFPHASLWLDRIEGILLLHDQPFELSPDAINARVAERGLSRRLHEIGLGNPADILGLFLLGPDGVRQWSKDAPLLVDDHPFLEFIAPRQLSSSHAVANLARIAPIDDPVTRYLADVSPPARKAAEQAVQIRKAMTAERLATGFDARASALEDGLGKVPASVLLLRRYNTVMVQWVRTETRQGRPVGPVLQRASRWLPDLPKVLGH